MVVFMVRSQVQGLFSCVRMFVLESMERWCARFSRVSGKLLMWCKILVSVCVLVEVKLGINEWVRCRRMRFVSELRVFLFEFDMDSGGMLKMILLWMSRGWRVLIIVVLWRVLYVRFLIEW